MNFYDVPSVKADNNKVTSYCDSADFTQFQILYFAFQ